MNRYGPRSRGKQSPAQCIPEAEPRSYPFKYVLFLTNCFLITSMPTHTNQIILITSSFHHLVDAVGV